MTLESHKNEADQMNDDLHRIRVAAADKESLDFELDSAVLVLEEAIITAVDHGQDVKVIAAAAELPIEKVIDVIESTHQPVAGN